MELSTTRAPFLDMSRRARTLGIDLDTRQIKAFERYAELLREWNARINLTAIVEPGDIATKHFLDSLTAIPVRRWTAGERLVDIGTGAGFPGIPLAIGLAGLRVTLVESVAKKIRFLEALRADLGLARVEIVHGRAEELAHERHLRSAFEVAVVRALPDLSTNLELLAGFVRLSGEAIAYKGRVDEQLTAAQRAADTLGLEISQIVPTASLGLGDVLPGRHLVVAKKARPTPSRYPRRASELRRRAW